MMSLVKFLALAGLVLGAKGGSILLFSDIHLDVDYEWCDCNPLLS